ncbi:MAG: hypothetical protein WD669_10185 [Pirellulales bacterium]
MRLFLAATFLVITGCGPSAEERSLSVLNIEADKWQGGANFATTATDAFGNPVASSVEKGPLNYVLEVRSNGPDGLPKNSDDIVVNRRKRHGETTLTEEAKKSVEAVSSGAASGAVKGIKEGLGFGNKKKE